MSMSSLLGETDARESEEKWPQATTNSFISSIINVFLKKNLSYHEKRSKLGVKVKRKFTDTFTVLAPNKSLYNTESVSVSAYFLS